MKQEILEHLKFAAKWQNKEPSTLNGGQHTDNIHAVSEHVQVYHEVDNTFKYDN